jgi:hypothetical protein
MSAIHIGKSTDKGNKKREIVFYMHIPLNNPVSGVIPTQTSAIDTKINQTERDALNIGNLVEKRQTIILMEIQNITDADVQAKLKNIFVKKSNEVNTSFDFEYKDYGSEITTP